MARRVTIMLDENLEKKTPWNSIKDDYTKKKQSVSLSSVINEFLNKSLK